MKILHSQPKSLRANTLVLTIVVTGLVGFLLASYMGLVKSQNISTMRSQSWNATIPVVEAGIEDALTHINTQLTNDLATNGWTKQGSIYVVQRPLGSNQYSVTISNWVVGSYSNQPVIEARGYVQAPVTIASIGGAVGPVFATVVGGGTPSPSPSTRKYMARGIRCTTRTDPLFSKGLVAKGQIDMKGNNISADSYNSLDPNYSTNGMYHPSMRKAGGSIATNSGLTNSLNVGNADIYGKVSTGPGGSIAIGPSGVVGDATWNSNPANQGKVQPGYSTDDMNVDFGDVKLPPMYPVWSAISPGIVDGTSYSHVPEAGNYRIGDLTMSGDNQTMIVTGRTTIHVTGAVSITGNAKIIIAPGGSLTMYVGGPATFAGNGIVNQNSSALAFSYYGLPSNTKVTVKGNGSFNGTIYAPNADLTLDGGGTTPEDFSGAAIAKSAVMNGHFKFHYDEALVITGPPRGYVVTTWNEMTPDEVAKGPSL